MAKLLIIGGAALTHSAQEALAHAGHAVRVYWSRGDNGGHSLRADLGWAEAVLDTSHAFDAPLRQLVALLATCPVRRLGRPLWQPGDGDRWTCVDGLAAGLAALPAGARVFAATGRDSAEMLGHHDGPVYLRQLQQHDDPVPPNCHYVFGAGPFDESAEARLFQELDVDVVMARNVGGQGSWPKLAAARALGLPVVLLQPDEAQFGAPIYDMTQALDWVAASCA